MSRAVAEQCSLTFGPSLAARIGQKRAETRSALMTAGDGLVAARLLDRTALAKKKIIRALSPALFGLIAKPFWATSSQSFLKICRRYKSKMKGYGLRAKEGRQGHFAARTKELQERHDDHSDSSPHFLLADCDLCVVRKKRIDAKWTRKLELDRLTELLPFPEAIERRGAGCCGETPSVAETLASANKTRMGEPERVAAWLKDNIPL